MVFKNKRQVVIINDIKSDSIEQAIFILRDRNNDKSKPTGSGSSIVLEAERIINNFLLCSGETDFCGDKSEEKIYTTSQKRPKSRKDVIIGGLIWLGSASAVVGLSVLILSFI